MSVPEAGVPTLSVVTWPGWSMAPDTDPMPLESSEIASACAVSLPRPLPTKR